MKKMRFLKKILCLSLLITPTLAIASSGFLQTIQIINFLSNTGLTNQGMTPTAVTVKFFNDNTSKPCWTTTLNYQADFTIHSGVGQSCIAPITSVTVTPSLVANILQTYSGPYTITIDTTKYAYQINIVQDAAPVFESTNGLIKTSGTITTQTQSQFR